MNRPASLDLRLLVPVLCILSAAPLPAQEQLDQDQAAIVRRAARFITRQARPVARGSAVEFPEYAETTDEVEATLYSGGAGVLIFLENAASVLDHRQLRKLADRTAAGLLASARETRGGNLTWAPNELSQAACGLYTGDPGVGHAFLVRARLRDDGRALKTAIRIADGILERQKKDGSGKSWGDSYDIISGAAGTMLFLIELGEETGRKRYLDAAADAGKWLIQEARESDGATGRCLHWPPGRNSERHYPNFSHGTAGVAYALARLAEATGDQEFLIAAIAGARWLTENGHHGAGTVCWYHYAPGREDSFREGWCHGPSGTGRLFLLLEQLTGQESFGQIARRSADWIMQEHPRPEDPDAKTRFYSPSLCCGAAGVIDFFVDLYRVTGDQRYRDYASGTGAYLERLAKEDGDGLKWTNYNRPDEDGVIYHGVSLMLGTSGEALAFLRLATIGWQADPVLSLPDRRVSAGKQLEAAPFRLPANVPPQEQPPLSPAEARAVATVPADTHTGDAYVVLTSRSRPGDPFLKAARELADWHGGELLTDFEPQHPERIIEALRQLGARHVAIVLPPEEIDTNTQRRFLMAAARIDPDIFVDVGYGFITGTRKTSAEDMVRRARRLQERGLDRRWIGSGVASSIKSTIYPSTGDPSAALAGFEGKNIYWGSLEADPDVVKFVRKELPRIEGGGVVEFTGCGDPEGIWLFSDQRNMQRDKHWKYDPKKVGKDPKGEMPRITARCIAGMNLKDTVVWSGVCHTGSLHRVFVEGDIVSTFGVTDGHTEYVIPTGRSIAGAILDAGAVAYICPLGANHGYRNLQESQETFERNLALGDIVRSTYNDIAVAQGQAPQLDLYLPENDHIDRARGAVMYGGGANRVLYGDPALTLFDADLKPAVSVHRSELSGSATGFRLEATVDHRDWWQWNMFTTDRNDFRIRILVELPTEDVSAYEVAATAQSAAGEAIEIGRVDAHVEHIDGKRWLHLQACAPRDRGLGEIGTSATFVVTVR